MAGMDIAIDLGTSTVIVYIKRKGIVLREPSVLAIESQTGKVKAIGKDAYNMIGKTPDNITIVRPLKDGVISDFGYTKVMIQHFIRKVCGHVIFKPRIMICIPCRITPVEARAVEEAGMLAGARRVFLIEEPLAAAIGAGIDISRPHGSMVVDIGGGTCDIAVLTLGGSAVTESIKVAGNAFDYAIIKYVRRKYNLLIGERTAEEVKKKIGCAYSPEEKKVMTVKGRNLSNGLPATVRIYNDEMIEALEEPLNLISSAVQSVLERTPPELISDIALDGIIMTGGGSLLKGLDQLLAARTGIKVLLAENAESCVALGTGKSLSKLDSIRPGYDKFYEEKI